MKTVFYAVSQKFWNLFPDVWLWHILLSIHLISTDDRKYEKYFWFSLKNYKKLDTVKILLDAHVLLKVHPNLEAKLQIF